MGIVIQTEKKTNIKSTLEVITKRSKLSVRLVCIFFNWYEADVNLAPKILGHNSPH